jgi:hypothetical protein
VYHPPVLAHAARLSGATLLAAALASAVSPEPAPRKSALVVEVQPVPLNPLNPAQESVGRLAYRGGLWLRSADPRFGGLSDLRVAPNRQTLQAISDCGAVFEAGLAYDARGFLAGLVEPRLEGLLAPGGRPLRKDEVDAEAMARDGPDGFVVAFEGRHHLWRYPGPAGLHGTPSATSAPSGLARCCDSDAGIEAMTRLPDGRLLLIAEGEPGGRPRAALGWVGRDAEWSSFSYPLVYDPRVPREPFHPTSVTCLPGSDDVLVLERRYPPVAARIRRVGGAAFERGTGLDGVEVARLDPPLTLDNYEGIDAVVGPRGETLLYVVSDDNNCAKTPGGKSPHSLQRTLLLMFELVSGPDP